MGLRDQRPRVTPIFVASGSAPTQNNGVINIDSTVGGFKIKKSAIQRAFPVESATAGVASVRTVVFGGTPALGDTNTISVIGWKNSQTGNQPLVFNIRQPETGTALTNAQLANALVAAVNARSIGLTAAIGGTSATVTITADENGPDFNVGSSTMSAAGTITITNTTAGVYAVGQVADLEALMPHLTADISVECARTRVIVEEFQRDGLRDLVEYHLYWGDTTSGSSAADAAAFAALIAASSLPNQVLQNA